MKDSSGTSQTVDESRMVVTLTIAELRVIVAAEIRNYLGADQAHRTEPDRLLTANETASILDVKTRWLYRHAANLPFTRRISRKNLRFSEAGLRRWLAAKKPGSR